MSHFYSLTGFPGEIQIKKFEIHQVERLNMSRVWITEARSSSCSLIFWLEHFTNERRHSWLLLMPQTAGTSMSLQGVQNISAHWTSIGKPLFSEQVLQTLPNSQFLLSVIQCIVFTLYSMSQGKQTINRFLSFYAMWKPTALLHSMCRQYTGLHPLNISISYYFYVINSPVISWAECICTELCGFGSWGNLVSVCYKFGKFQIFLCKLYW